MKEIIHIHVGTSGIRMGSELWKLYGLESPHSSAIFEEVKDHWQPRALLADLDYITIGQYKKQFAYFQQSCQGVEDGSSNYIKAAYTIGKNIADNTLDQLQKLSEKCESPESFIITHSTCGGTGSGFIGLLLERMRVAFPKKFIINISLLPSPKSSNLILETYNSIFALNDLLEYSDLALLFDNQTLFEQSQTNSFTGINKYLSHSVSSLSLPMRFWNQSLFQTLTNLVPKKNLNFVLAQINGGAPLASIDYNQKSIAEIHNHVGSKEKLEKKDCVTNIFEMEPQYFEDDPIPKNSAKSCTIINTPSIGKLLHKLTVDFDKIYTKRAYVHWYFGEGLSEDSFSFYYKNEQIKQIDQNYLEYLVN